MSSKFAVFSEQFLQSVGLSLIHSIWQAALVALIVFVLMRILKNATAQSRYFVALLGLIGTVILPTITFLKFSQPELNAASAFDEISKNITYYVAKDAQDFSASGFSGYLAVINSKLTEASPLIFWFWLTGTSLLLVKWSLAFMLVKRLKYNNITALDTQWQLHCSRLSDAMNIRKKIGLFESDKTNVPMMIGYFRPIIIVPLGIVSRLPFDQVEMILAHELAHIKRSDYLVNYFQLLVEALLFFNPFVWWISDIIRKERENICDDIAIQITGKHLPLAKAIANLSLQSNEQFQYTPILYFNKFNTMKRIERIFKNPRTKASPSEKMMVSMLSLVFILFISASGMISQPTNTHNASDGDWNNDFVAVHHKSASDFFLSDTTKSKKTKITKNIEVEMLDGTTSKLIINGEEMSKEALEKQGFTWVEKDSAGRKTIVVRKDKLTSDASNDSVQQNNRGEKSIEKRIIIIEKSDDSKRKKSKFADKKGKNEHIKFHFIDDESKVSDSQTTKNINEGDKKKEVVIIKKSKKDENAETVVINVDKLPDSVMRKQGKDKHIFIITEDENGKKVSKRKIISDENIEEIEKEVAQIELHQARKANKDANVGFQKNEEVEVELKDGKKIVRRKRTTDADDTPFEDQRIITNNKSHFELETGERIKNKERLNFDAQLIKSHQLFRQELVQNNLADKKSVVILSKKQLIVDGKVLSKKNHKKYLHRFEEITNMKIADDEAVSIRK